jgi:dipeptidyl aminopeptidase/acylaminoacyl peptidase
MVNKKISPYGSWESPIKSDMIASESIQLDYPWFDGEDIYWGELRPSEGGRIVIVRRSPDGQLTDMNPPSFNARTRVHEYGGRPFTVEDGVVYFSNFDDQRLYRVEPGDGCAPLTPETALRYADGILDKKRLRMICVLEDHRDSENEAVNSLVSVSLITGEVVQVLASGNDFYSSPCLSPDGSRLAWLTWNHPNMPWDGTELWVGEFAPDGALRKTQRAAGWLVESIYQPQWSPDGRLYFVSDRENWWNLYHWDEGVVELTLQMDAEFGKPQWVFGTSTYDFESPERIICTYTQNGIWHLASIDTATNTLTNIETPYTQIVNPRAQDGKVVFLGGSPTEASSIILLDLETGAHNILRRSTSIEIDPAYLSTPEAVEFPTTGGLMSHGLFYPPRHKEYTGPEGERPPLLVKSHGGPTAATNSSLNLGIQYWTSRGIAVLDVNYGGSTGYGREYRQRLNGQWGVVDMDDCENGALYLGERGDVDAERIAITGGSAGGYTTLCALTFRGDTFKTGASHFGVSDLAALALHTHKFESRYLDTIIGPYPQAKDIYKARSPIHHTHLLKRPIIFFQGLEDLVVPPAQAEKMVDALRAKGLPVAYLPFEGEQHGFRKAENIKRALDAELYFYSQIFDFQLADPIEPVEIENL